MPDDKISELPLVPSGTPSKPTDEAVVNFRNPDGSFTTMRDTFAKMKAFFSGDKENTGVAASLLSSHIAQSNPHSQYLLIQNIVDNLTSSFTNDALSANQGRVLKGLVDTMQTNLDSINLMLSSAADIDNVVNKVAEVLAVFTSYPEGLDLYNELQNRYTKTEADAKFLTAIKTGGAYYQQNKILLQNGVDIVKIPQLNRNYIFEDSGATSVAMNLAWATANNLHTEDLFIFENRRTTGDVTITADGSQVYFYIDGVDQVITLKPKQAAMLYRWSTTAYLGYSVFLNKETSTGGGGGGIPEPTVAGNFLRTNTGTWVEGVLKSVYDTFVSATNTSLEQKIDNIWTQELQDLYTTTGNVALNDTLEVVINKLNNKVVDTKVSITAGEALVGRNLVYLDTDGKYRKADYLIQSRIASEILIVDSVTIANNATGTATLRGAATGFTGLTVGSNYYVGENGAIVSEANLPDIDGMFQKYIGEAVSATTLNFNPSSHYYEIEVTGVVGGLATVRTLVDQHWFVVDGKPNADGTGTLTSGSEVRSIISKTGGLGGNRAVYQDLTEPAITQQIPTRPNGGVPTYVNNEGGFLHIANGLDIQYRFLNDLGDIDATGEFWYVCRLHTGKSYEAIMSGDRGPELKRLNTGVMQYNPNDYVTADQTFSYTPIEFETVIFHFIYNKTSGTCNIRVTDSVGDYRDLTTKTIPTTSILRNFGVGTSSHPASHDFFAYLFKFGSAFGTTDRATILSNLKATYPIGQLPSKSFARPTMGYNSGTTTFTITPNYVLRGGATSINNASTVVRWYMLKNNVSTGTYPNDALANITLIATTTGTQLSLNISSYPQFVTGGSGVGDEIVGAITVFDNLGAAFEIECATDPRRTI